MTFSSGAVPCGDFAVMPCDVFCFMFFHCAGVIVVLLFVIGLNQGMIPQTTKDRKEKSCRPMVAR